MPQRRPPRPGALLELQPLRIIRQIFLLQLAYYLCAFLLILFTTLVAGEIFTLDLILSWKSVRGDTTVGWTLGLCWMLDALTGSLLHLLLIARSKLVLDFVLTLHLLHLIITSFYTQALPTNLLWWGLQIASATSMTILGIWACQWRELKPINFGGRITDDEVHGGLRHIQDPGWKWDFWKRGQDKASYEMVGNDEDGHI